MAQFTYDPASIGSGEHSMAFIVGSHPRFGSPALVSIKANLVGPPKIDLLNAEKFSGFEPKAASAFEKARDLAVQNNTDHILIVDPFGLASTQARLWTA